MHRLRRATKADVATIQALEQGCPSGWSSEALQAELAWPRGIALVIDNDRGEPAGWCAVRYLGEEAELLRIAVKSGYRRRGLARQLLERVLMELCARGVVVLHLEVRPGNLAAIALYRQYGFTMVGRRPNYYTAPVEDALLFSRNLKENPGAAADPGMENSHADSGRS